MGLLKKMRIRSRLLVGFGICIVFSLILATIGVIAITRVNSDYSYLVNTTEQRIASLQGVQTEFMTLRYRSANFVMNAGDLDMINNTLLAQYNTAYENLIRHLDKYDSLNNGDTRRDPKVLQQYKDNAKILREDFIKFKQFGDQTLELSRANDAAGADAVLKSLIPFAGEINALVLEMITPAENYRNELVLDANTSAANTRLWLIVVAVVLFIIACALAVSIGSSISKPINVLRTAAIEMANGNLDINLSSNLRDETGDLSRELDIVKDAINSLVRELNTMSGDFDKGEIDTRIDASLFKGSYKKVAEGVNYMVNDIIVTTETLCGCMGEFSKGNFNADMPMQPGKKAVTNQIIANVRQNLKLVAGDIDSLAGDAIQGKLSSRADVSKYNGDWANIMTGLNRMMDAVIAPIQEASAVLEKVAAGNFDILMEGDYQGDHRLIKTSLNNTVTNIDSYIDEISKVLTALAQDNLDQEIKREYVGKFSEIKDAINNIIDKFNNVIADIAAAADQVAAGTKQISESSMTLAQGATEQASAIEELNATVYIINESTAENSRNAKEAKGLSDDSKNNAAKGNQDMSNMLASMEGIKESSNSISKIIKVIDDIAFQTNLLALNAAVEAARAGTHGKGFAVVAEEVRSLAARSQNAARETSELIEESISRVNEGTKIADQTANALQTIVSDVTRVADIITGIAVASQEQTESIGQVKDGTSQIAEVIQSNSATSEESASASQQLASQAEMLQNLVSVFKLKRVRQR